MDDFILRPSKKIPGKWFVRYMKGNNAITEFVDSREEGVALLKKNGYDVPPPNPTKKKKKMKKERKSKS